MHGLKQIARFGHLEQMDEKNRCCPKNIAIEERSGMHGTKDAYSLKSKMKFYTWEIRLE